MLGRALGMGPASVILAYNSLLFTLAAGLPALVRLLNPGRRGLTLLLSGGFVCGAAGFGALASPIGTFGKMQLLAWAVFVHCPVFLLGASSVLFRSHRRVALAAIALATAIVGVGVDAFLIEPHWLAVDQVTIRTDKLERNVRVAVVADVQTDRPGRYERRAFRRVRAEEPDVILLVGDYIHEADGNRYVAAGEKLNQIMEEADLDAPLGIYAVRGNVDREDGWQEIFAGLPVTTFERSHTLDLSPLTLTGLTFEDSANAQLVVAPEDGFHIVLGHVPNFSLGQIEGDVLIAGHTHGGQIQLPFVGPLITLSEVPRAWASGVTEIAPGRTLVVSRGIGMEREQAPRMRFLCRPQLVILDLVATGP